MGLSFKETPNPKPPLPVNLKFPQAKAHKKPHFKNVGEAMAVITKKHAKEIARGKIVAREIAMAKQVRTCTSEEMLNAMVAEGSLVFTEDDKSHWTGAVFRNRSQWKWARNEGFGVSHSKTLLSQGGDRGTKVWLYIGK